MAQVKPIVLNNDGTQSQISSSDTIPIANLGTGIPDGTKFLRDDGTFATPSGGGGFSLIEVELDFGTFATKSKKFIVTNGLITNTRKIVMNPSGNVATGRVGDDWDWDSISTVCKSGTGDFTVTAKATGKVRGKRKFFYTYL